MSQAQDSRKRSKKRYGGGQRSKKYRGSRELEVGMQGILITCNMNERKCTAEAFNLLNEYADQLYGPENEPEESGSEEDEDEDVEAALKKEVKQLKASSGKRERRFLALDSGANNVIFIKTKNLDPDKLVHHILSDLHLTKKKKSRVILRMLPVSGTCKAFQEDMDKYLSVFLEPWFKVPNHGTYQIAFKARNSSHNKREDIIKTLAGLVGKMNPKNKVDLTTPELTIIVEVIKSVCCVSVVRDYMLYRKYNLQEVVKEEGLKDGKQEEVAKEVGLKDGKQEEVAKEVGLKDGKQEEVAKEVGLKDGKQEEVAKEVGLKDGKQEEVAKQEGLTDGELEEIIKKDSLMDGKQEEVAKQEGLTDGKQEVIIKKDSLMDGRREEVAKKDSLTDGLQEVVPTALEDKDIKQEERKDALKTDGEGDA
ncbi:THUMP domain-containing protein 1 isoform X2 [Esox lucius]|uniref:THUMP domain-containing protein 1 isoform X2 n=1 Tax=Esox lucius TaxID=8010 RepID=UPI0010BDCCCE|nr:THUMP domain-containing protein 1 isoform X2 [Esox lucius]